MALAQKTGFTLSKPRWSADNARIVFRRVMAEGGWTQDLVYELATGRLYEHGNTPYYPAWSPDGSLYVYSGASIVGESMDIVVRDSNGSERRLTNNRRHRVVEKEGVQAANNDFEPSFSPDGRRVIFKRSAALRERSAGGRRTSDWDVFEANLSTGQERRLTHYRFSELSQPYYLPDGERFVFSASGPKLDGAASPAAVKEYERLYQENRIFVMDGKENGLRPAFVNGPHSAEPQAARNGAIVFLSATNAMDGLPTAPVNYDLFVYREGAIARLTKMRSCIAEPSISADGSRVVFLEDRSCRRDWSMWIVNTDGTGLSKIKLPQGLLKEPKK